jgi:hypothetical protein
VGNFKVLYNQLILHGNVLGEEDPEEEGYHGSRT